MPSDRDTKRLRESFVTHRGGVSTAFDNDLIGEAHVAWAKNMDFRGGKPRTRGGFTERLKLPRGTVQGVDFFTKSEDLIFSISGYIHQCSFGRDGFELNQLTLPQARSSIVKQVFMEETSGFLVIQDGLSSALIYDGVALRNAESDEVPRGFQMAYGNGRLWVALDGGRVVAGDIAGTSTGSELKFTEDIYLLGGGSFVMPGDIKGMRFVPSNDARSAFGPLLVQGQNYTVALRADIADRNQWSTVDGFQSTVFPDLGTSGHYSTMTDNTDLVYRDNEGKFRTLRQAVSEYGSAGTASISREVSRITDNESSDLLQFASSIGFADRMFAAGSPFYVFEDTVGCRDIVSMDFSPNSSLQGQSPAIYNGEWEGFNVTHSISVVKEGEERAFFVSKDSDGNNRLWEYTPESRHDISLDNLTNPLTTLNVSSISSSSTTATVTTAVAHGYNIGDYVDITGTLQQEFEGCRQVATTPTATTFTFETTDNGGNPATTDSQITVSTGGTILNKNKIVQEIEYRRMFFGDASLEKRIESFNIWASEIQDAKCTIYYRKDEDEQWYKWDDWEFLNKVEDDSTATPHVWKELRDGQKPEIIPFTTENLDESISGFSFQVKLRIEGHMKIDKAVAYAQVLPNQEIYAQEETRPSPAVEEENEITPIELFYEIPTFDAPLEDYTDESSVAYEDELANVYEG